MTTLTTAPSAPTTAPSLPDLDPAVLDAVGDEMLLSSAASTKVAKVKSGTPRRGQPVSSRAWSRGGNVD